MYLEMFGIIEDSGHGVFPYLGFIQSAVNHPGLEMFAAES